jgi:hypothetical protein
VALTFIVIPAKAGIQGNRQDTAHVPHGSRLFAGMTEGKVAPREQLNIG